MKTPAFPFLLPLSFVLAARAVVPSVGPEYQIPAASVPAAYRDASTALPWKTGEPADALARGDWWTVFGDRVLDRLESRALTGNQSLRAALARVEEARAAAGLARSDYWPKIAADGVVTRERTSRTTDNVFPEPLTTTYRAPLTASWEIDLFGRVRRLSEAALADAQASAATFESVRLALTAEVASTYFSARAADRELGLVRRTADLRQRALDLVSSRRRNGTAADLDVARAETELATAQADVAELGIRVARLKNSLAVLLGEPASDFELPESSGGGSLPQVPAGLPAALLERRPDIAAAERALAAANARIGVAKAAFFPAISLTGSAGFASGDVDRLFQSESRIWAIGPSLYLPIFQGGRNRANLARSRAAYAEAVASYRQSVLVAFREVQDALTATRLVVDQSNAQERALASATRAARLAQLRYDAGYVSYLEVVDAQRTALAIERASAQLEAQRLNATVALIKALGGGWSRQATGAAH